MTPIEKLKLVLDDPAGKGMVTRDDIANHFGFSYNKTAQTIRGRGTPANLRRIIGYVAKVTGIDKDWFTDGSDSTRAPFPASTPAAGSVRESPLDYEPIISMPTKDGIIAFRRGEFRQAHDAHRDHDGHTETFSILRLDGGTEAEVPLSTHDILERLGFHEN